MKIFRFSLVLAAVVLAAAVLLTTNFAKADRDRDDDDARRGSPTPPGLFITPTALKDAVQQDLKPGFTLPYFATNYPNFVAGEAVKALVNPDGTTLAVLTAGMNSLYFPNNDDLTNPNLGKVDTAASTQFLFLYDITGAHKTKPALKQVIQQLNSHVGLVWAPNSKTIYAAGGCDDAVYAYTESGSSFAQSAEISLGHAPNGCVSNAANQTGLGLSVEPNVAGIAVTSDGKTLVAANNYNDSISVIDTATGTVRYEYDLRPFATSGAPNGTKGGTFPFSVVLKASNSGNIAYVGSDRDREVIAVNITSKTLVARIPTDGNPNGMTLSADGSTLYVAQDNQDQVAVIDTNANKIAHKIDTRGPAYLDFPKKLTGAAPTAVTVDTAKKTLYAVNAGSNSIAVIPLTGAYAFSTIALLPTAYDPTDVAFSADGSWMYIVNGKNNTGPNPLYGYGNMSVITFKQVDPPETNAQESAELNSNNQYQFQLEHATLVSAQVPDDEDLWDLTSKVAANNSYRQEASESDDKVVDFLHSKIKHVIYIVKENRTFDQILGDLHNGSNGDPSLALFGERTPGRESIGGTAEQGYLHCGPNGAGHFVKMVHNGIEYGLMAAYAEGLSILRSAGVGKASSSIDAETTPLRNPEHYQYDFDMRDVAEVWRRGSVIASWLLDLTAAALVKDPALAQFEGRVSDSGEGRWTIKAAIDEAVPAPVLSASLYQRFASRGEADYQNKVLSAMRYGFGGHLEKAAAK